MEVSDHIAHRNKSYVNKENVKNYLKKKSDELIKKNNLIVKLLKIDILGENDDDAWKKVDTTLEEINNLVPRECFFVLVTAKDFNNSSNTGKKSKITKKSIGYGYPHINLLVLFKNTEKNENEWKKFVEKYNEKNKYTASEDPLEGNDKYENLIGFVIKNDNNKFLKEKLNNKEAVDLQFFETGDIETYKKIKEFFTKLKNLGVKISEKTPDPNNMIEETNDTSNEETEKTSRPEDEPFKKFIYELADYMKKHDHKIYVPSQTVFENVLGSDYSFEPEIVSKGSFDTYLNEYVKLRNKEMGDNNFEGFKDKMFDKNQKKYKVLILGYLPQIEFYDCVEFKNCIYSVKTHCYWNKNVIETKIDKNDKEIHDAFKELKEKFACLTYFDMNIDINAKATIFEQILDNSLNEEDKLRFILATLHCGNQ